MTARPRQHRTNLLCSLLALQTVACLEGSNGVDAGAAVDVAQPMSDVPADLTAGTCSVAGAVPELALPTAEVKGVLRGTSRNASTTCTRQKGTGGPEAFYALRVRERALVELEVVSDIDTVVAIRTACDDALTELACGDDLTPAPLPTQPGGRFDAPVRVSFDGGSTSPGVVGRRDGAARAVLDPGTYYVLVDEAEPHGVGGAFTLKAKSSPPPAHSSCTTPMPLMGTTRLMREELDLAGQPPPACGTPALGKSFYYTATIPSGERLTARARPTGGDRTWLPGMQVFTACATGMCLGTERAGVAGDTTLEYVNHGPTPQTVLLAVGAKIAVNGATFELSVSVAAPPQNLSCRAATRLVDGTVLRQQNLAEATTPGQGQRCGAPPSSGALYYTATLLENQHLILRATPSLEDFFRAPLTMAVVAGCDGSAACLAFSGGDVLQYQNRGPGPRTVIVEVSAFAGAQAPTFDLDVTMPLPPGGMSVNPTSGLRTTEAGGTATFEVVLSSPPEAVVTIPIESGTPGEGKVMPAELKFDGSNWDKPQRVTVTGVDDSVADGLRTYTVFTRPAKSDDIRYAGLDGADVQVTNRDDEPGFTVDAAEGLATSEAGGKATFTVELNRKPSASVRVALTSSDPGEGTVSPPELVFTPETWSMRQVVTVTGVDDKDRDAGQTYTIVTAKAVSDDPAYAGIDPPDVTLRNRDDDYQTVAPQPVSANLGCFINYSSRQVAVDDVGTIYAVFACHGTFGPEAGATRPDARSPFESFDGRAPLGPDVFLVTSTDGGLTFSAPRPIGVTSGDQVTIAGGAGGHAYVVAVTPSGLIFTRTEDAGGTWSTPRILSKDGGGGVKVASAGARVAIVAGTNLGPMRWRSNDGGRAFTETALMIDGPWDVGFERDGRALWMSAVTGEGPLRRLADGGPSAGELVKLPNVTSVEPLAVGGQKVFAKLGGEPVVHVVDIAAPTMIRPVSLPLGDGYPRAMAADRADNLTVLNVDGNRLEALRLPAGATEVTVRKSISLVDSPPSIAALADTAVVVMFMRGNQVQITVQAWP